MLRHLFDGVGVPKGLRAVVGVVDDLAPRLIRQLRRGQAGRHLKIDFRERQFVTAGLMWQRQGHGW